MEMLVIAVVAILAFVAVLLPLFRRGTRSAADEREFAVEPHDVPVEETVPPIGAGPATPIAPMTTPQDAPHHDSDDIEREVLRYRAALRAGTLCVKCGEANPAASAFCADCGRRLPLADAREFE